MKRLTIFRLLYPLPVLISLDFIMSATRRQEDFKHEYDMMKVGFLEDNWM